MNPFLTFLFRGWVQFYCLSFYSVTDGFNSPAIALPFFYYKKMVVNFILSNFKNDTF